ncbi:heavy metal-binding domain-containing protein [Hydrogenivirga sp.]
MWFEVSLGLFLVAFITASLLRGRLEQDSSSTPEENVIVTYSKSIPGYEVKRIIGYVESVVTIPNESEDIYASMGEQSAIQKLMEKAQRKGANAILELRVETEEHVLHTKVKARGLAVRV